MKTKNKVSSIVFFVFLILLLANIKVCVADPPDWIGIKEGAKFKWSITVYGKTYMKFYEDSTGTTWTEGEIPNMGMTISLNVIAVSDQFYNSTFDFYWVNVSVSIKITAGGVSQEIPTIGIVVPRNDTLNYFTAIAEFMDYYSTGSIMYLGFLIVPTDINWDYVAEELNLSIPPIPEVPDVNFTVSARDSGLEFLFSGGTVDTLTLDSIYGYADFYSNGIVKKAVVRYGGDNLISLTPEKDEIPGFELLILLGLAIISTIGIIFYLRKDKRIII